MGISYTFLPFWHCSVKGFAHGAVPLLSIQVMACRGLFVKGWNHRVGGGVGVVLVIGQYLGLKAFSTAGWPRQHRHCPRNLGILYFHSVSSLQSLQ